MIEQNDNNDESTTLYSSRGLYKEVTVDPTTYEWDFSRGTEMKLNKVSAPKAVERAKDYNGRNRIWPGLLLLFIVIVGSVIGIVHYANKATSVRDERFDKWVHIQKNKLGIKDDKGDNIPDLVDSDGLINNPKSYKTQKCVMPNYVSKNGKFIAVSPNGTEVTLGIKGTNWFGMETGQGVPFGLWQNDNNGTTVYEVASFLSRNKFNSIRLPTCIRNILDNISPDPRLINLNSNRAIDMSTYMNLLKSILKALSYRNIGVLISLHTLSPKASGGSWFSKELNVTEVEYLNAVGILTKELCTDEYWNVIGLDLKNEPADCGWGPDDAQSKKCDWTVGATKIANKMLEGCPKWVGFVEGSFAIAHKMKTPSGDSIDYFDWWGGHLQEAKKTPIKFSKENKIVWSPHYYTTAVHPQAYFYKSTTAGTDGAFSAYVELPDETLKERVSATMEDMFGFLRESKDSSIILGEFGGLFTKDEHPLKTTRRAVEYTLLEMKNEGYSGGYMWSLNPESKYDFPAADKKQEATEGLLETDWLTPNKLFMDVMTKLDDLPNLKPFPCFTDEK